MFDTFCSGMHSWPRGACFARAPLTWHCKRGLRYGGACVAFAGAAAGVCAEAAVGGGCGERLRRKASACAAGHAGAPLSTWLAMDVDQGGAHSDTRKFPLGSVLPVPGQQYSPTAAA